MTVQAAARWMASELQKDGTLYQEHAVGHIHDLDEALTITNSNGNLGIRPDVLKAFNKLTPDAVWSRSGRYWRKREDYDIPGRQQP
ncbi:DUF6953 family protein [Gellertiella hungarica]|uniref:Uncharacterized protein n=1 Tax=Gellertiella hungarica TaxID=1572859 RepID=A0A7W6NJM9_9HYPH|nr:hypothetical protein [Gellertiella hungarica]MBB4063669.1 hypothetical protein [Gellertiella hungarica]